MRLFLVIILSLILTADSYAYNKTLIIAVVDTGFGYNEESLKEKHLCKYGHKDFTNDQKFLRETNTVNKVPKDMLSHGTQVVGLIDKAVGYGNYCFVIIKFYSGKKDSKENEIASINAMEYVVKLKPDIVNFSAGGYGYFEEEALYVKKYLDNGGIFVAAAGNEQKSLDFKENAFYPAMYDDRIIVVGNKERNGRHHWSSNYGESVKYWEVGTDTEAFGIKATGTSQATAIKTAKIVKKLMKERNGT